MAVGYGPAFTALAIALAFAYALGRPLIAFLRMLSARQHAYEDAPKTHQVKTGTPTMGGLLFLLAPAVAAVASPTPIVFALALLVAACAGIGALDDFLGIRLGRNRGLTARTKFLLTALAGVMFLGMLLHDPQYNDPQLFGLGHAGRIVFYVLGLCAILASTHAVNLTDGLDGLAGGTILPPLVVLAAIAFAAHRGDVATFILAMIGAIVAFLAYNMHPAKLFMGDTGSLALGAALAGAAVALGMDLLLLLIGGVFVAEAISVIVQVASFKMTKKRVFRMSPLHHHFELGGWPETRVTQRFWIASLLLSVAGYALVTARS